MPKDNSSAATIGFVNELWRAADALRSSMDAAEHKGIALGLILLKSHHRGMPCSNLT